MKKVSVIIPCYNVGKFVKEAMLSVINQTYSSLEIICIDDCSTDNTLAVLKELSQIDNRIFLYQNEQNLGLVATLNKLVKLSNCDLLIRMDPDDVATADRIEKLVLAQEQGKFDVVSSNYNIIDEYGFEMTKKAFQLPTSLSSIKFISIFSSPIPHAQSLIKKEVLTEFPYDANCIATEDYNLWVALIKSEKFKFCVLNEKLYYYRLNPGGMSAKNVNVQTNNHERIAKDAVRYLLDINVEKFEFWKIAKKTFDYQVASKDVYLVLSQIGYVANLFFKKHQPTAGEKREQRLYLAQYTAFCYKNVIAGYRDKGKRLNGFLVVFFHAFSNVGLFFNWRFAKWMVKNS